jgi:hypothetical protein
MVVLRPPLATTTTTSERTARARTRRDCTRERAIPTIAIVHGDVTFEQRHLRRPRRVI